MLENYRMSAVRGRCGTCRAPVWVPVTFYVGVTGYSFDVDAWQRVYDMHIETSPVPHDTGSTEATLDVP